MLNEKSIVTYSPPKESFVDRLGLAFEAYADRMCVKFGSEEYTYAEVDKLSRHIATDLAAKGFGKGDHGAVYSLNSARVLIVTLGILRAGGVWIPVNPKNSESENVRVLSMLGCKAVFYQTKFFLAVDQVSQDSEEELIRLDIDQQDYSPESIPDVDVLDLNINLDDLISLPLTGGTTGLPKGVRLNNTNFNAIAYGVSCWHQDYDCPALTLCVAPMTHAGGRVAVASMISGSSLLVHEAYETREVLKAIQEEQVTDIFLPPTAIYSMLEEPALEEFDRSSLRTLLYGSAPISIEKLKQALRIFGPVMRSAYGQTECPTFIAELAPEDHFINGELAPDERLKSVGHATALSEIAIVDENCDPLPVGELGEIATKGAMVCDGYYQSEEETAKIQVKGWHLTGDIGYLNADGFLYLVDRKKDMIVTGGFNVYSSEVEHVINRIPGVRLSQVIGVPSERWGEEVKALVQLEAGSDLDEEQISTICRDTLGSVKMPKSIEFREVFPLTSLGKVDKKTIRAEFWVDQPTNI